MSKLKVNDISMYYEIHGAGEPLVLISGFSGDHFDWQGIVDMLSQHYQVILFDNRGVGQTDAPACPYTVEMMANDVVALCNALDIQSAYFIGHSMGGSILQELIYKNPKLVKKAIICNSDMKFDERFSLFASNQLKLIKSTLPADVLVKNALHWTYSNNYLRQESAIEILVQFQLANPYPVTVQGYEGQLNALLTFDSRKWIDKLDAPCLVIGSDEDMIVHKPVFDEMAELMPDAQYHCFEGVGHNPFIEKPEEFISLVLGFLEG